MGCGASNDPKIAVANSNEKNNTKTNNKSQLNKNGFKNVEIKNNSTNDRYNSHFPEPVNKAPLAFVISFDENSKKGNLQRPPPGRLQLEPLKTNPKQMQAQLDEKMKAAEMKREQILSHRIKSSAVKKRSNAGMNRISEQYDKESYKINYNDNKSNDFDDRGNNNRQRLLNKMRIVRGGSDNEESEIEHDQNYRRRNNNGYEDDNYG